VVRLLFRAKRAKKSAGVAPQLSATSGGFTRNLKKTLVRLLRESSHGAAHPGERCMPESASFDANFAAPGVQKIPPIEHWMPPSEAGKDAPVGGLPVRATYTSTHWHRGQRHGAYTCGALCRTICPIRACGQLTVDAPIFADSRVLGAQLELDESARH
jgi:hypothetical protein